MSELDKELFINMLEQASRFYCSKDVADEMCDRLDKAKKSADVLEQIYNLHQQQWQQFRQAFIRLPLP